MDKKKTGGRPRISRVYRTTQIPFPKEVNKLLEAETPYEDMKAKDIKKLDKIIQERVQEVRDSWTADDMRERAGHLRRDEDGNEIEFSTTFNTIYSARTFE